MKAFFLALAMALALAAPQGVLAQSSATPVLPGYLSTTNCSPGITACYVGQLAAIAGTQTAVTITSATALTIPSHAIMAVITVAGTNNGSGVCAYWRDDGMAPTTTAGQPLAANAGMVYFVMGLPIKMIQASGATCTMTVSYYG